MASFSECQRAADFIILLCPTPGAFHGELEPVSGFLAQAARDIKRSKPTIVFPDRHKEHISYAVEMVVESGFTEPPAAIASVYLATRFEYYFRVLSGRLKEDGKWLSEPDKQAVCQALPQNKCVKKPQISSVSLAYKIMMLKTDLPVVKHCAQLDSKLFPRPIQIVSKYPIANLGERIKFGRNATGHGSLGDISSEAYFYGLMTALIFYGQTA